MKRILISLLFVSAAGRCFGMSEASSQLLNHALEESTVELQVLKTEHRQKRAQEKLVFDDVTRPAGRKTARIETKPKDR